MDLNARIRQACRNRGMAIREEWIDLAIAEARKIVGGSGVQAEQITSKTEARKIAAQLTSDSATKTSVRTMLAHASTDRPKKSAA